MEKLITLLEKLKTFFNYIQGQRAKFVRREKIWEKTLKDGTQLAGATIWWERKKPSNRSEIISANSLPEGVVFWSNFHQIAFYRIGTKVYTNPKITKDARILRAYCTEIK